MTRGAGNSKIVPEGGGDGTGPRLYELQVQLLQGPLTRAFLDRNPSVMRTIRIRGDQTLERLHEAIFEAFDRFDPHLYEFQVGGMGPMDPKARRYVVPPAGGNDFEAGESAGTVKQTTIASLELRVDEIFGYWFDFGDDWWHQVTVLAIHDEIPRGRYPKITERVGESPPQYVDWDEEAASSDD